jgi:cytochrome P450 family 6
VFFAAGFETSSTTMTFCLYELAVNPDIQERLRAEIDKVLQKHGGNITYESIFEMEYLEKVVDGKKTKSVDLSRLLYTYITRKQ